MNILIQRKILLLAVKLIYNYNYLEHYANAIKNIFSLIVLTMDNVYKGLQKKKNINIFSSLIKKTKKNDLSKSAIFRIFTDYVLDKNDQPLLNQNMINEFKVKYL
jgi:hypothetical protein